MKITSSLLLLLFSLGLFAQKAVVKEIRRINSFSEAFAPLRFLASDELMGRGTYRPEIHIAARYISEYFRVLGLREVPNTQDYFQNFTLKLVSPANQGELSVGLFSYKIGVDIVKTNSGDNALSGNLVYVGYGNPSDLDKVNLKGKIVISDWGMNDSTPARDAFAYFLSGEKQKMIKDRGAIASIERFKSSARYSWAIISKYFTREHPQIGESDPFGIYLIQDDPGTLRDMASGPDAKTLASLKASGGGIKFIMAQNVMGWVEGSDKDLKNQFVVLSAHYDHLGVAKVPKMQEGKLDSIYNGARDNAIGTAGVLDAAHYFSHHPPKRSILFIAYTGEEIGEFGSKYFADNPPIPLKSLVYNMNIDNASYNDTTIVTVVGLGRTSADEDIKNGCQAFGLRAVPDPAPEQNLFDRSDNTNLAEKGIPAPTFSLGFTKFDAAVMKRYHQLSDEVGNLNLNYCYNYINGFILAAKNIANNPNQPFWVKDDKYESAWKNLYGKP